VSDCYDEFVEKAANPALERKYDQDYPQTTPAQENGDDDQSDVERDAKTQPGDPEASNGKYPKSMTLPGDP
jgi:hypothetical protein